MKYVDPKAKPARLWTMLLSILILCSCTIHQGNTRSMLPAEHESPCGAGRIRLFVVDQDGGDIGGVSISAVASEGIRELGITDSLQADICIDNGVFLDPSVKCILFCREGYFCGAVVPTPELAGYWELMMALARHVVS